MVCALLAIGGANGQDEVKTPAQGVEKLLRTPTAQRDAQNQLWSDDEFFQQYAEAIRHDMNDFIARELKSDYYLEEYGQEQSARDAAECLRLTDELIERARTAYRTSLEWFENELTIFGHQWESTDELPLQFRVALHNRLLRDLFSLGHNDANRWVSTIHEIQERGTCLKRSFPEQFDAALSARGWSSTPGFAQSQYEILRQQRDFASRYRNYILHELYEIATPEEQRGCPPNMYHRLANVFRTLFSGKTEQQELQIKTYAERDYRKAAKLFLKTEQAWNNYMNTLHSINYPISNNYFSGSGVNGWCLECENAVQDSHNSFLLYLMRFAGNGLFPYTDPIDFTEFECQEEELTEGAEQKQLQEQTGNFVLTADHKRVLYEKAHGVEKLLRTKVELRDCTNENAWSDDDFFQHYEAALREDIENFIDDYINCDFYREKYGKEQMDYDIATCRDCVRKLVEKARLAYNTSLKWLEEEVNHNDIHDDWNTCVSHFKNYLRNRLMEDLFRSQANDANYWMSGIYEDSETDSCIPPQGVDPLTAVLMARSAMPEQYPCYEDGTSYGEKPTEYRNYILTKMYNEDFIIGKKFFDTDEDNNEGVEEPNEEEKTDEEEVADSETETDNELLETQKGNEEKFSQAAKRTQLFLMSEAVWNDYIHAMINCTCPVYNQVLSGSGYPGWMSMFTESIEDSHENYLLYLISNIADGGYYHSSHTDFTKFEHPDLAKEKIYETQE